MNKSEFAKAALFLLGAGFPALAGPHFRGPRAELIPPTCDEAVREWTHGTHRFFVHLPRRVEKALAEIATLLDPPEALGAFATYGEWGEWAQKRLRELYEQVSLAGQPHHLRDLVEMLEKWARPAQVAQGARQASNAVLSTHWRAAEQTLNEIVTRHTLDPQLKQVWETAENVRGYLERHLPQLSQLCQRATAQLRLPEP